MLITELEKFSKEIPAKRLVILASIAGCEFYHKLGYEYVNDKKELNDQQMYMMEKFL